MKHYGIIVGMLALTMATVQAEIPTDPLQSMAWSTMHRLYFDDQPVVFDDAVELIAPPDAEDSLQVPIAVRYHALDEQVEKIIVFVDYNPIPTVLEYFPIQAEPFIGFNLRLQQASPVRAAALTQDGVWHVSGQWVHAQGGGCTMPSPTDYAGDDSLIGQVNGRLFDGFANSQRLKLSVRHPMDTGLVVGVPAYFVEELTILDDQGNQVAHLKTYEPLSENPLLTLDIISDSPTMAVQGRDNNGLSIEAILQ